MSSKLGATGHSSFNFGRVGSWLHIGHTVLRGGSATDKRTLRFNKKTVYRNVQNIGGSAHEDESAIPAQKRILYVAAFRRQSVQLIARAQVILRFARVHWCFWREMDSGSGRME
jgi:hypothetical protein